MSLINKEIGDFAVQAYQNEAFRTVTKADVLGKWSVFFFYPADFTFVCPTELEDLENNYAKFKEADCEVYSVSCDTHFVHKAWHDHSERIKKITYPMLADPTHVLARDFDVLIEDAGLCGQRRPQRGRASEKASGLQVRRGARRRGLPGEVAARRRDAEADARPRGSALRWRRKQASFMMQ